MLFKQSDILLMLTLMVGLISPVCSKILQNDDQDDARPVKTTLARPSRSQSPVKGRSQSPLSSPLTLKKKVSSPSPNDEDYTNQDGDINGKYKFDQMMQDRQKDRLAPIKKELETMVEALHEKFGAGNISILRSMDDRMNRYFGNPLSAEEKKEYLKLKKENVGITTAIIMCDCIQSSLKMEFTQGYYEQLINEVKGLSRRKNMKVF